MEVDVRSPRSLDAKILQRKRQKQNGSSSKEKQAKSSDVQKGKDIRGKAKQLPRDADLSDSPEPAELPSPKRVRKQARSSPAIPSPSSKYKVCSQWVHFPAYMCGLCTVEHTSGLNCCVCVFNIPCTVPKSKASKLQGELG